MLKIGEIAPELRLLDQDGNAHSLVQYRGKWVLIYFYPKDDTPGCTKEACTIQTNLPDFNKLDAVVLGISADSVKRHKKFSEKYNLQFPLLSDEEKEAVNSYGVWQKKKFMGREYMGILRNSFLISPDGKIAKIYEQVKPEKHAEEVVADIELLRQKYV